VEKGRLGDGGIGVPSSEVVWYVRRTLWGQESNNLVLSNPLARSVCAGGMLPPPESTQKTGAVSWHSACTKAARIFL